MRMEPFYVFLLVLFLILLWIFQFAQLMTLGDELFPGRFDKTLWAAAFILVFPVAPFAFMWWKRIMLGMRAAEKQK
jgi:hypothetical protein